MKTNLSLQKLRFYNVKESQRVEPRTPPEISRYNFWCYDDFWPQVKFSGEIVWRIFWRDFFAASELDPRTRTRNNVRQSCLPLLARNTPKFINSTMSKPEMLNSIHLTIMRWSSWLLKIHFDRLKICWCTQIKYLRTPNQFQTIIKKNPL